MSVTFEQALKDVMEAGNVLANILISSRSSNPISFRSEDSLTGFSCSVRHYPLQPIGEQTVPGTVELSDATLKPKSSSEGSETDLLDLEEPAKEPAKEPEKKTRRRRTKAQIAEDKLKKAAQESSEAPKNDSFEEFGEEEALGDIDLSTPEESEDDDLNSLEGLEEEFDSEMVEDEPSQLSDDLDDLLND